MWAQLGDVVFDILTGPDSFEASNGWDYAEHKVVGTKPKLQHTGQGLEEITLGYGLHVQFCDPKADLDRFREAAGKKEPLPLVMGSGEYRGRYVITALSESWEHTAPDGRILSISGRLTLKEHVGDTVQPAGEAQIRAGEQASVTVESAEEESYDEDGLDEDELEELEAALEELDITPVEFPGVHNALQKLTEVLGWPAKTVNQGLAKVNQAAAKLGATGVGSFISSAAGLALAALTARTPAQAVSMATSFLGDVGRTPVMQAVAPALGGDFFGAAAKALKLESVSGISALFPVRESAWMAQALVTRLPVYRSLQRSFADAASREFALPRELFAQPRSYAWMRDIVRFPA